MLDSLAQKFIPPKPYLVLGNRMFSLSIVLLIISAYFYDVGEAFVAVEVGIIHYLYNLKFSTTKDTLLGSLHPLVMTLTAVPLSMVPITYAPFTSALFAFLLVITERDKHHQGVPKYILPLTFMLLSMMMPVDIPATELMLQRSVSVVLGITVAIIASTLVWRNTNTQNGSMSTTHKISRVDLKYSSRKALGIGLVLSLGIWGGTGAVLGAYLFMMIHSPFSKDLAPKAWQRLNGTLLGALVYLPVGLLLGSFNSDMAMTITMWVLVIASLYGILVYLEHNYTIATACIMLLILTVSVGPFNPEMAELIFSQRVLFTVIGGAAMVVLGVLIPLNEKEITA
ncbi:putative membrane protein [Vibrio harveyi]|uniref:FUSC family protein n=1 Tax=Vibrio harveyi TaxID=669 RepID=UPI00028D01CB|nr:FUSC family protein [Vibrio harveyi]EKM16400.1 putative membrane protein [Vibrio harveyi]